MRPTRGLRLRVLLAITCMAAVSIRATPCAGEGDAEAGRVEPVRPAAQEDSTAEALAAPDSTAVPERESSTRVDADGLITYDPLDYGPFEPLSTILARAGIPPSDSLIPQARIEIHKSRYRLVLFSGERELKRYKIQLGGSPVGEKRRRGDERTPERSYRICGRNRWSRYYRSLQIDYPNAEDVRRAREARRLSAADSLRLEQARAVGCPPGNTRLGGEIFLHGQDPRLTRQLAERFRTRPPRPGLEPGDVNPQTQESAYNWTLGCVALSNPDIRELFRLVPDGTPVEIFP